MRTVSYDVCSWPVADVHAVRINVRFGVLNGSAASVNTNGPSGSGLASVLKDGDLVHLRGIALATSSKTAAAPRSSGDGGLLVDVTVEPADSEGAFAVTWALPSGAGAQREGEGLGTIRRDGFVAPLAVTQTRDYGRTQEIHVIEIIAAP